MTTSSASKVITTSSAVFKSEAIPTCDPAVAADAQPKECSSFTSGAVYNFGFSGITRWSCLDVKQCGRPVDHYNVPATGPIPEIFKNTAVWENIDIKPNGLSLDTAPIEVTIALLSSQFTKCLVWNKGMQIPAYAFDDITGKYKQLPNLPYMCGQTLAYLIKDPVAAAQISVDDFLKLSAADQVKNGAYKTAASTGTISKTNLRNPISVDKYNPNDGRYSSGYIRGVQYAYGATVNQANRVFVCNSNSCNSDPVLDRTGKIWTFKNTDAPPPSRKVLIDPDYSSESEYFQGYFARQNGSWYTCIAQDKKKMIGDGYKVYNHCNILNDLNLNSSVNLLEWRFVGLDNDVDLTQPVIASPWNANVDWAVGDYYADTTAKKVFQCTGGANKDASLCRTKFALNTDQWKDVTTVTLSNGTVQNNYDESFSTNKPGPRYRVNWHTGTVYFKGDIIEVGSKDRNEYFICKGDACATTDPAGWRSTDNTVLTAARANWGRFNSAFEAQNPDFDQYDINVNNAQTIPEFSYSGFSEQVLCDFTIPTGTEAFTTTSAHITYCDGVNGEIVRVCNSSLTTKCAGFTKAQLQALPRSRAIGNKVTVQVGSHFRYVSGALYGPGDVVLTTNTAGLPVYYKVGPFNPFDSSKVSPFTADQDAWIKQGHLIPQTGEVPKDPVVPIQQDCVPIETIGFFTDLNDVIKKLPEDYDVYKSDDHSLQTGSFICDTSRVFKCIDTATDNSNLCSTFGPDSIPFIWQFEPTKTPKPFKKLTFDDVIYGKVYDQWSQNPFRVGEVVYQEVNTVLKAFTCSPGEWQAFQCSQKTPGVAGSESIWVETSLDSKILVNRKARATGDGTVPKAVHSAGSDTIQNLSKIGKFFYAFPQIRYSEFAALKATTYKDFTFFPGETVAVDNGFVFMCWDEGANTCRDTDPVDPQQKVWELLDNVVASSFQEIPVVQVLEGWAWQKGYPYVKGDIICNSFQNANVVKDGFQASLIDANGGDTLFWDYYEPLHPYYYRCTEKQAPVPQDVQAEEYSALARFDILTGDYSTIQAGVNVYVQGRIYECIITAQCNQVQPFEDDSTWRLTNKRGVLKAPTIQFTLTVQKPALAECLLDDFKEYSMTPSTANAPNLNNWSISANSLLNVQGRQMCSSDNELRRKLAAGQPKYKPIGEGKIANLPYNMVIYKQAVNPNLIAIATLGKDFTIRKQHIETAFASYPLFCGDAPTGQDPIENCRRDVAGFAIFIKMFNLAESYSADSGILYSQTGFDVIIDKKCWAIVNSKNNGFDLTQIFGEFAGEQALDCTKWQNRAVADTLGVFPEYKDAYYFARGTSPFPLIGAADYGMFSQVLLTKKTFLLENPSSAEDPRITALVAMWRYMSYGVNNTTGPSIHDIFTGNWQPNEAEAAAGLSADQPVNSALAVVYDSRPGNDGTQSCSQYFNVIPISEVAKEVMAALRFPAAAQNQDLYCSNYGPYPRGRGPNAGFWLQYNTETKNCQLTNTPTPYHAFRYGDVKACMADAEAKGDYVKSRNGVKSTKKWFTNWMRHEPYVNGNLAGFSGTVTNNFTRCRICVDQKLCSTQQPTAVPDAVWAVCDGENNSPAPANTQFYENDLHVKADIVDCVQWVNLRNKKIDTDFVEIVRPGTPYYVCKDLRVFSCITSKAACLAVADPLQDAINFKLYPLRGKDAQESLAQLYCEDNTRYGLFDVRPEFWSYDFSNLEFKNFGQVCSYDRNFISQISRGFQYTFLTATGLSNQQLASAGNVCGANSVAAACNQSEFIKTKQFLWDEAYTKIQDLTNEADKKGLLTVGIVPIENPVDTKGLPTWQYQDRPVTSGDEIYVNKGWTTLPTRAM